MLGAWCACDYCHFQASASMVLQIETEVLAYSYLKTLEGVLRTLISLEDMALFKVTNLPMYLGVFVVEHHILCNLRCFVKYLVVERCKGTE